MKTLEIARRRLRNSRLIGDGFESPNAVVRWHGAMQAQDYGPAKWSIGQRAAGLVDEDLDRALATGSVIRTHLLRPTWHFVAREDVRWLLALTGPRIQQHNGRRYRELGLDQRRRRRCESVIASALEGGNRLTRKGVAAVLDAAGIDRSGQRLPYVLMHCELEAVICSGGLSGKQQTYALLDERVPNGRAFDRDEALVELVRRYLTSHGPASVKDMSWWSGLTTADIRRALDLVGREVRSEAIDDIRLWSLAPDEARAPAARGALLLQPYDEVLVGFTESRYFGDPRAAAARASWGNRGLPNGVVLLNGGVAGLWRRTLGRASIKVEVFIYERPKPSDARALGGATAHLARFVGLPVTVETARL